MNWADFSDRRIRICCPANNKKLWTEIKVHSFFIFDKVLSISEKNEYWLIFYFPQTVDFTEINTRVHRVRDLRRHVPKRIFYDRRGVHSKYLGFSFKNAFIRYIFFWLCVMFFISLFISIISPSVSVVKYARNSYREAEKEIIIFSGGCKKRFFLMILILYF